VATDFGFDSFAVRVIFAESEGEPIGLQLGAFGTFQLK
jgi:hypothetical protein